jgi:hypothetical protein
MRRARLLVVTGALVASAVYVVSGCSVGSGAGIAQSWIAADPTGAVYIAITANGSALSGNLDETDLATPNATSVSPIHEAFTGTITGSSLTLIFPEGFGLETSISGNFNGSTMSLQIPQPDGTLGTTILHPGTSTEYNTAVTVKALEASATQAVTNWNSKVSSYESQVKTLLNEADSIAQQAQSKYR